MDISGLFFIKQSFYEEILVSIIPKKIEYCLSIKLIGYIEQKKNYSN